MSIIYGLTYRNGKPVSQSTTEYMRNKLSSYKLDALRSLNVENGIFWCGAQNITPESLLEELPCYGTHNRFALTADAILDNRKDLLYIFNIPKSEWNTTTDSDLIMLSYNKWKEDCPKYLVGDFAFVIWDTDRREIFGARDHVGKRTFYYHLSDSVFTFCTVMRPLLQLENCSNKLNDNWIADYLSLSTLVHEIDCTKTIYKDIQQLLPGHCFKLNNNSMTIKKYWNPGVRPELKYKSDFEYIEAFREVFIEAVKCRLRSNGGVGIMLSGGLDSSSVATLAASHLKCLNKSLKAYSFIPVSDYIDWLPKDRIASERDYVEEILKYYDNIDIEYCDFEGLNALSKINELTDIMEHPYKIVQNFFWANQIAKKASESGCKVLLSGQFGNLSVSSGDMGSYLLAQLKKGRVIKLFTDTGYYAKLHHVNYSVVLKNFIKLVLPDSIKQMYDKVRGTENNSIEYRELECLVNSNYAYSNNVDYRLKTYGYGQYRKSNLDMYEMKKMMNDPILLSQLGCVETKSSIYHKIAERDPTRDKRVIEFCMRIPIDQLVYKGQDRSLIRRGLYGYLPDKIRNNYYLRGRQSADFVQRLKPHWSIFENQLTDILNNNSIKKYVDREKIINAIKNLGSCPKPQDYLVVQMLIYCLVFGRFILSEGGDAG